MRSGSVRHQGNLLVRRVPHRPPVESVLAAIVHEPGVFALESTAPGAEGGRYTIIGCRPIDTFQSSASDWLDRLEARVGQPCVSPTFASYPFACGWVGFICYEAGPILENVASTKPRDLGLPHARFALYDSAAVYDSATDAWTVVAVDWDRPGASDDAECRADRWVNLLADVGEPDPIDWNRGVAGSLVPSISRRTYADRVAVAKRYIRAGDIYQVNLTQRLSTQVDDAPLGVYRRVRVANPSAYAAYLPCGESTIISASPELFLDLRGREVRTRPIKGTRPRVGDPVIDAVRAQELQECEKDQAELAMIVDLMRNDLGRVCEFGTVRVASAAELETHPTVFHLVGTVTGELRGDRTWADLLRASFPGGSITGCPKIRAMRIIDELETTERGVYCGSIGYIGLDGGLCLNIAIRTMVMRGDRLHLFGGGAIVADSEPDDEYAESLAKIEGLSRALGPAPFGSVNEAVRERSA
jgi:para-aminobenzoate synthetase component 1